MLSYAGIGTREKNPKAAIAIHKVAMHLFDKGYHLNSGGADFSDTIHEQVFIAKGAHSFERKSIFLPWDGFNGRNHNVSAGYYALSHYNKEYLEEAYAIAAVAHPNWAACSRGARALHTRNVLQVLGANLSTPVSFVVAYTSNGQDSGGTAQACRIARARGIPVYNVFHDDHVEHLLSF